LRDDLTPDDFVPIEQALKRLPYFEPSSGFADRVMARVTRFQDVAAPGRINPVAREQVVRMPELVPQRDEVVHYLRRPLPVRVAAIALLGSAAVTMSVIALIAVFRLDLFMLVMNVFGEQGLGFLAVLGNQAAAAVLGDTAVGYLDAAGSLAGVAMTASFAVGAVGATTFLRAAASAPSAYTTRKAA
jgi:hypothetical protein